MGIDFDHISEFNHIDDEFIKKQASIRDSYIRMGVEPTFSCTPYDIFDLPEKNTQVSFAESNAAIFANSLGGLKTNKESAFSACLLYTSPSPRDLSTSRMPSSA